MMNDEQRTDEEEALTDDEQGGMAVVWEVGPDGASQQREYAERPNKSALKREMQALQQLAGKLLELTPQRLQPLGLSERLTLALAEGRRLKVPDARRRHLRFLARLLGQEEVAELQRFSDAIDARQGAQNQRFHHLEQWRDRLLKEGDAALGDLLESYPRADRQQVRQLIRAAQREAVQAKPPAAARKLFKLLRALEEG
jgi:ribosome-associated protein